MIYISIYLYTYIEGFIISILLKPFASDSSSILVSIRVKHSVAINDCDVTVVYTYGKLMHEEEVPNSL